MMQERHFIRYAAFIKDGCNCARFVTDALISGINNEKIKRKLIRSKWFTPSTIGNVVLSDNKNKVYEVSEEGKIKRFESSVVKENRRLFLDKLKDHSPSYIGTLHPKPIDVIHKKAQWLGGIAAGAWFELHPTEHIAEYFFKRISPYGNIDVHDVYIVNEHSFNYNHEYRFVHYSNCKFFHIEQNNMIYKFERKNQI